MTFRIFPDLLTAAIYAVIDVALAAGYPGTVIPRHHALPLLSPATLISVPVPPLMPGTFSTPAP